MNCLVCLEKINIEGNKSDPKYHEYHDKCFTELFGSLKVNPFLSFNKKEFLGEFPQLKVKGMSISGVQPKLMASITNKEIEIQARGGEYIIKPSPEPYSQTSENEHLSMKIGLALGIPTPPLGLVKFSDGELAYIIKRFDRLGGRKRHQEDMAQIFTLEREEEGLYKYSKSYEEVGKKIKSINNGSLVIALHFLKRLLHNFIIQNGDYHLKNISLQMDSKGLYSQLTPNYDSLNSRIYFPQEHELALDLLIDDELTPERKRLGYYTQADFLELSLRLGINKTVFNKTLKEFFTKQQTIQRLISASYLSEANKTLYHRQVMERFSALQ